MMRAATSANSMSRWGRWGITALALFLAGPLVVVVLSPLHVEAPAWHHVLVNLLPHQLGGTLLLLAIALITALAIAVPCAWLVSVHHFPFRRFFGWALVLPLALPTYIAAYTWAALFGPTGSISLWCAEHLGFAPDILNIWGLGIVLGLVLYPYIYLPARAMFARGMSAQLEAARMLGSTGTMLFRRIAIPLARPAIAAGSLLVGMEVLNDFGAVKHYGVQTLTTGIFRARGGLQDGGSALRLGILLIVLVAVLLWSERRSRRNISTVTDQVSTQRRALSGVGRWSAFAACALVLGIAAGLPFGKIIGDVVATWAQRDHEALFAAFGHTALLAAAAAFTTLLCAVLFTFRERHGNRSNLIVRAANLGYAIPGAVIALGALVIAGAVDNSGWGGPVLIGSVALLLYAYTARFLAVGTQPLFSAVRAQPSALDDAARALGASRWSTFLRINLPLLRPAMLAASLLVAVDVIKELPLTLILRPFNFETLSTSTYRFAAIEQLRDASVPALLIVLCAVLPLLFLERLLDRTDR